VTVKIYSGPLPTGTLVQTLTATAGAGGSYSVRAVSPLPAGSYTARSQQDDQAGNTGLSSANTFSVTDPIIVAGGDIAACEEGSGEQATAAILDEYPDATVAVLGDTAYPNGTASEFANCYDPSWGRARSRTLPAIGDHEYGTPNASGYFAYFNEQLAPFGAAATDSTRGWYSYDLGVWHVVVLNSNCAIVGGCAVGSPMEQWLRADLAAHPAPCTLAYWHHPRFSSGGEHGNNTDVQPLFQALHDSGVDVVLNGNDHIYERYAPQTATGTLDVDGGVREFVVGTGGAFLYPIGVVNPNSEVRNNVDYGALKLTLHPTSYDWQFLAEAGGTFTDSGTTQCHGRQGPPPPPPGAPSVRAVSSNVANRSTTLTIDRPAGTLEGDVLLAIVGHQNGQSRNMSAPTGWTAAPNTDRADQNNVRIHGWYKVAGPAEPATYTFTLTGGSGQDSSGGILAISGARASAPIDASGGQVNGTASKSVVAPSVTTTSPATLLVFGGACNWPVTYIPPPGMLERWDRASGSASSRLATEAATEAFAGPAATGTKTATATASCRSVGILIAVAPA
jgi:hypothetical protein